MKRTADLLIGQRFVEELYRLVPEYSDRKIAKILGCGKSIILEWKDGRTPNGMFLASAMELGCDIEYVLTGRRKTIENTPDFLAELEEEHT